MSSSSHFLINHNAVPTILKKEKEKKKHHAWLLLKVLSSNHVFSDENIFRKLIIINSKRMLLSFPSFIVGCFVLPSNSVFFSAGSPHQ